MNLAHLHLLLNHFPIIGTLIGIGFMGYAYFRKDDKIGNAAHVLFIVMALITIPVFYTGAPAEHLLEDIVPNISHETIHDHEEAADFSFYAMLLLGGLSFFSLWKKRNNRTWNMIVLIGAIAVFGLMARVGYLGGQIQHAEIKAAETSISK